MSAVFPILTPAQASEFARLGLTNVRREYPHLLQHMLNGPEDVRAPRALHPAFYGSYDWHSCVHQHGMLVRLARLFPDLPERGEIDRMLREHLTAENIAAEAAYFQAPGRAFFERPYGWAWLLKFAAELRTYDTALAEKPGPAGRGDARGTLCLPDRPHPPRPPRRPQQHRVRGEAGARLHAGGG